MSPKGKHVPVRRCACCMEHFEKSALLRVVKTPEGDVVLDETGKRSGRGAYVCKTPSCAEKSKRGRRLDRSLGVSVPEQIYDAILARATDEE